MAARPRSNLNAVNAALTDELAAIGLKPGATAAEITAALRKYYPHGTSMYPIDPRTGLPYTQATGRAAGSGNVAGQVVGGLGLGLTVGGVVDNLIAALRGGVAATEGGFEAGGVGAGAAESGTGAGAGGAEAGGTGGGAAAATLGAAGAGVGVIAGISDTLDFLKWIAWLFHPLNLLRAVEFLTGFVTMFYGISILMGVMRRGASTHRTTLRSIFAWTPWGKRRAFSQARRRGRRAGEVQAERDVAYRGARQERARQVGAHQRRLGESTGGTGGTGGTGRPE